MYSPSSHRPAAPLTSVAPLVPRRLAQAIDRCLAKDRPIVRTGPAVLAEQLSHALEQRRELPVALRAFVKHDARLDGSGVLLYAFAHVVVAPLSAIVRALRHRDSSRSLPGHGRPARRASSTGAPLLNAGFGHGDIGVAFKAEIDRRRQGESFRAASGGLRLDSHATRVWAT